MAKPELTFGFEDFSSEVPKTFECTNSFSLTLFTGSAYKQVKGYKQIPETEKKNKR